MGKWICPQKHSEDLVSIEFYKIMVHEYGMKIEGKLGLINSPRLVIKQSKNGKIVILNGKRCKEEE